MSQFGLLKKTAGSVSFDQSKVYPFGDRGSGVKPRGDVQVFQDILQSHRKSNLLFKDPQFSPKNIKLGDTKGLEKVEWKRPREIVRNPKFTIDGFSRHDIQQGMLGDCWFLAAVANVAQKDEYIKLVAPDDQDFEDNYAGVFHFRFWQYGRWLDIVIDDRLPTINGKLIFLQSDEPSEFWPSLLEKAYAKLNGSYEKLIGGLTAEALEDLTGGLSVEYSINTPNLREIMLLSYQKSAFMGCAIMTDEMEQKLNTGLVGKHAYTVTNVRMIRNLKNEVITLIRIRNPWGQHEWQKAWSDESELWNTVPEDVREELLTKDEDGEFWMDFNDFLRYYSFVEICYPNANAYIVTQRSEKVWKCFMFDGSWTPNVSAGGFINYSTFCDNPQYILNISGADPEEKHNVIIALMQKNRRINGQINIPIGCFVFKLSQSETSILPKEYFKQNLPIAFIRLKQSKQITHDIQLTSGSYCVVPCASDPNMTGDYLLRVFADVDFKMERIGDSVTTVDAPLTREVSFSPQNNDVIREYFMKMSGPDKEIDWIELRGILNVWLEKKILGQFINKDNLFSKDLCRSLIAHFDTDYSGKLNYEEFSSLCLLIFSVTRDYNKFDVDNSGSISATEFKNNLEAAGFVLNNNLLHILLLRYGNENGELEFTDYLLCIIKLRSMNSLYNNLVSSMNEISLEKWFKDTIYS